MTTYTPNTWATRIWFLKCNCSSVEDNVMVVDKYGVLVPPRFCPFCGEEVDD